MLWELERKKFLAALDKLPRHRVRRRAEMLVLYDTGMRVSELAHLSISDFDRKRGSLLVENVKAKGRPKREVPLHPRTVRSIGTWMRERPDTACDALFVSQKGNPLSVRQIQEDYRLVCKLAGLKPTGVHTLRHTAATRLLDEKVLDPYQVARRLGHRDTSTTFRYYVHGSVDAESKAISRSRL